MAQPKKRTSRAKRDSRRATKRLKPIQLNKCPNCGQPFIPHRVCPHCGYYNGRQITTIE